MAITLADVETALIDALEFTKSVAPLAALGGPAAGAIGAVVAQVAATAETLVAQVGNDASIIAGGDVAKITALQAQLQQQNAALTAQAEAL